MLLLVILGSLFAFRQQWWPGACHWQAQKSIGSRDFSQALIWLDRVSMLAQDDGETWLLRARAMRKLGRMEDVRTALKNAHDGGIAVDRLNREQWLALAQSGQMSQAEPFLSGLLKSPGDDLEEICDSFVLGYMRSMNFAKANQLIDLWVADFPDSAWPLVLRGRIAMVSDDFRKAEESFRLACEMDSGNAEYQLDLAGALRQLSRVSEAIKLLRTLAPVAAVSDRAKLQLAICLRSNGDTEEALSLLEELTQVPAGPPEARKELARSYLEAGESARAEEAIRAVLETDPKDEEVHYILGQVLQSQSRTDEAMSHFQFSDDARKAKRELNNFRELIHRNPRDTAAFVGMGRIMIQYGQPEEGVLRLLAALELDADNREAHELLAAHYEERASVDPQFETIAERHRSWIRDHSTPTATSP